MDWLCWVAGRSKTAHRICFSLLYFNFHLLVFCHSDPDPSSVVLFVYLLLFWNYLANTSWILCSCLCDNWIVIIVQRPAIFLCGYKQSSRLYYGNTWFVYFLLFYSRSGQGYVSSSICFKWQHDFEEIKFFKSIFQYILSFIPWNCLIYVL